MVFFKVRLPRRRQLKGHLNHRNFEQVKQADRLDQNGDGTSTKYHEAGTVEFPPFTHGESPVDSTRLQERKTDHGNGVTYKRLSSVVVNPNIKLVGEYNLFWWFLAFSVFFVFCSSLLRS